MKRELYSKLLEWKNTPDAYRKPLILEGARQTGKSWLAQELGDKEFETFVEVNFEKMPSLNSLFEGDFDINRIILALRAVSGKDIQPGKTLIFLDEIGHAPRGLMSLKFFKLDAPEYHVIAADSFMGLHDHDDDSFPVGYVKLLKTYPLNFPEFLTAVGEDSLVEMLKRSDWELINVFSNKFTEYLRQYYFTGGMPEVVKAFVNTKDYLACRQIQKEIIETYEKDFTKHPPKEIVAKMRLLWQNIPAQLSKENKKFTYSAIKKSARARDYEEAIQWLCDAGAIYKVTRVSSGELPLDGFADMDSFKLFLVDIGLLGAMTGLTMDSLITGNEYFKQFKGALTEQYVMQQLVGLEDIRIHYWSPDTGMAEVDFVIQLNGKVIPLEAKAERNLKAKSLKTFSQKYQPEVILRTSLEPYFKGDHVTDIPLYALSCIKDV